MTSALLALVATALTLGATPPYGPGEQTEYAVDYLGLPMGKALVRVGRPVGAVLPVFLEAQTTGLASLFTFREQLATFLDVESGLPSWNTLDAVESGYRHRDRTDFDRPAGRATVREIGRRDVTTVVEVPAGTVDFVALVFKLRTLPLEDGQRHSFPVLSGTTASVVATEVVAREWRETAAGRFRTVKVRVPTGFGGSFKEQRPTFLWFSDDERRVLVRIVTEFRIGRATAELVRYAPGSAVPLP